MYCYPLRNAAAALYLLMYDHARNEPSKNGLQSNPIQLRTRTQKTETETHTPAIRHRGESFWRQRRADITLYAPPIYTTYTPRVIIRPPETPLQSIFSPPLVSIYTSTQDNLPQSLIFINQQPKQSLCRLIGISDFSPDAPPQIPSTPSPGPR
jgi:hypothetical protein